MTESDEAAVSEPVFKSCYCGHGKGAHAYPGERQPGACEVPMCVCQQYQPIPEDV